MQANRVWVRFFFGGFILFLFVQFWFSLAFNEPYPAIVMPDFKLLPETKDAFGTDSTAIAMEIYAYDEKGDSEYVDYLELLRNSVQKNYSFDRIVSRANSNLKKKAKPEEQRRFNEFRGWVKTELLRIHGKPFERVSFRKVSYKFKSGESTYTRKILIGTEISLPK